MKIWAKLLVDGKVVKDTMYNNPRKLSPKNYEYSIREICQVLDISTPIILPAHFNNFANFNNTKFKENDFVEGLDFEVFLIEHCKV